MTKNYEDLTIRDAFMFGKICSIPENRKIILDSLLQIDLREKSGDVEMQIREYKDSKYTRLDLISEDESNKIYNAEMQNESSDKKRQEELPYRARYYQSIIDTAFFKTGESYLNMPETYIIFICTFDPYGLGLPIYTFNTKCTEISLPEYSDKAHKIFFNTTANLSNLPKDMRNMLEYINTGVANDTATKCINDQIVEARVKEAWRAEYMLTVVHDRDVYTDGYTSRQPEIDALNTTIANKDATIADMDDKLNKLTSLLAKHGINPEEAQLFNIH